MPHDEDGAGCRSKLISSRSGAALPCPKASGQGRGANFPGLKPPQVPPVDHVATVQALRTPNRHGGAPLGPAEGVRDLCRGGTHMRILRAISRAAETQIAETETSPRMETDR